MQIIIRNCISTVAQRIGLVSTSSSAEQSDTLWVLPGQWEESILPSSWWISVCLFYTKIKLRLQVLGNLEQNRLVNVPQPILWTLDRSPCTASGQHLTSSTKIGSEGRKNSYRIRKIPFKALLLTPHHLLLLPPHFLLTAPAFFLLPARRAFQRLSTA